MIVGLCPHERPFLSQPQSELDGVQLIDIRGTGDNTLMLDASRIRSTFDRGEILVVSDSHDWRCS